MDKAQVLQHITHLVSDRLQAAAVRKLADEKVRGLDKQIAESLTALEEKRIQLTTGAIVTWIQPADKETIVREKLLAVGVTVEQIKGATETKPVSGYVKIDPPKAPSEANAGEPTPFGELPPDRPTTIQ
jgi:dsDNA-specific endonuclease/ATPase MutS2